MATKQKVIDFIKHDRTLLGGRNLYNHLPNKSLATQNYISRLSNTTGNLRIVCYELCKLVGIPERQMNALLNQPVVKEPKKVVDLTPTLPTKEVLENALLSYSEETTEEDLKLIIDFLKIDIQIPTFSKGQEGTKERKELATTFGLDVKGNKHTDYDKAFEVYKKATTTKKILEAKELLIHEKLAATKPKVKESIKLRDQFPFLKENDCPDVLKLLVADLITAHETFVANQPLLHQQATAKQLKVIADTVTESYIAKKEVFNELEYYGKNKSLLGEHPIFDRLSKQDDLRKLNSVDLAIELKNITGNINRNKKKLKEAETDAKKQTYTDLIEEQIYFKGFVEKELKKRK